MIKFPSETIGSLGERKFEDLCERAGLSVSKPLPDSTGKDRLVEFPFVAPAGSVTYDTRPPPLACCVQVKTLLAKNDRCELSLTNAERLARDSRPAFVAVLRIDDEGDFIDMYLLHVDSNVLAKILKRLRKEHAKGTMHLNQKEMKLSINAGNKIDLDPHALRQALATAIGADMFAYADRKRIQLKELGYNDYRYQMKMALRPTNIDHLLEGFLGLHDLSVEKFESFELRFGIALPAQPTTSEVANHIFRVQPQSAGRCTIAVKNELYSEKAVVEGAAYFAEIPGKNTKYRKALFRTDLIDFILHDENMTLKFNEGREAGKRHKLQTIRQSYGIIKVLSKGECVVIIQLLDAQNKIVLPNCRFNDDTSHVWADHMLNVIEAADQLRRLADVEDNPVAIDRLMNDEQEILKAHSFMSGAADQLFFEHSSDTGLKDLQLKEEPVIVISPVIIGDEPYAYAVRGTLSTHVSQNDAQWVATKIEPLVIKRLGTDALESYRLFAEKLAQLSGVSNIIQRKLIYNDEEDDED